MNLSELAVKLTVLDTGYKELNIAQAKKVLKCVAKCMADDADIVAKLIKHGQKGGKK